MSSKLVFNVPCPNNIPDPSQAASLTSCVTSYILGLIQPSQTQTFGGFNWNLYTRKFPTGGSYSYSRYDSHSRSEIISYYTNYYLLKVYLECNPEDEDLIDWECTTDCQIHLVQSSFQVGSRHPNNKNMSIMQNQLLPYKSLTFSGRNACQYVDDFYRREQPDLGRCLQTSILFCCDLEKCNLNKCVNEFNVTITDLIVKC
uniref:MATH domain-containing protein n=1 Tax=Cacopsylla melanoneura TaxID=428564 RepID=A0A8D8ZSF6_9HEMI